ncbi:head-tail connector protein [Fusobacteria bacterium ZRK30]|nr:head-tail connector protein [Fusobacteria bacterium ZRK30]
MLTLDEIKLYLRVDDSEEDKLITQLELFSREEIKNSTGVEYVEENPTETYKLAQLIIIADRYENRASEDQEFKPNNILSCLYSKLKYSVVENG